MINNRSQYGRRLLVVLLIPFLLFSLVIDGQTDMWGDINDDDKIGLEEAIHALQITSGLTIGRKPVYMAIIGTGGVTGVYYPTGGAIARTVNKQRAYYGVRCAV